MHFLKIISILCQTVVHRHCWHGALSTNASVYLRIYTCVYTDYRHKYVYIYIYIYTCICMHACMHACMHTYIHTYMCICVYMYMCIYVYKLCATTWFEVPYTITWNGRMSCSLLGWDFPRSIQWLIYKCPAGTTPRSRFRNLQCTDGSDLMDLSKHSFLVSPDMSILRIIYYCIYIYVWDYNTYKVTYIYVCICTLIHTRCIPVNHWTLVTMPYPLYRSYPPVTGAGISEG